MAGNRNLAFRLVRLVLAAGAALILSSCHTMMEATNPYEQSKGPYTATKNDKGETIFVRETAIPKYISQPVIYPVMPVSPAPLEPVPRYKPTSSDVISTAPAVDSGPKTSFGFLEIAGTKGNTHMGIHFAGMASEILMGRMGGSIFISEELFLGLDLSARAYIPINSVKPFGGVGVYYGDTKKCSQGYTDSSGRYVEHCEKKFLGAGYVELGFEIENVSVFWRDYNVTRAGLTIPTESFWGVGVRF